MHKSRILGGLILAALAVAGWWWRSAPPPGEKSGKPAEAVATIAAPAGLAAADSASTTQNNNAQGDTNAQSGTVPGAAPAAPAVAALPQLPVRAVPEWRTHAVPEEAEPPPAKPLDLRLNSPGKAAAPVEPAFRPFASLQQPASPGGAAPAPGPSPGSSGPRGTGPQIAGTAEAAGAAALRVGGRPLPLFGIRPPASGDRCAAAGTAQGTTTLGNGAQARRTLPCQEQAQDLLAARLAGKAKVSCRFPGGSRQDSPAICLDGDGVDLGGFLVAEGLALADPAQSYDYVGAEGIARAQKRGLWLFR